MSGTVVAGKKLVVLGAQEIGVGAALLAKHLGIPVFVSDAGVIPESFSRSSLI